MKKYSDEDTELVRTLREQKFTISEIVNETGLSESFVKRISSSLNKFKPDELSELKFKLYELMNKFELLQAEHLLLMKRYQIDERARMKQEPTKVHSLFANRAD